MGVVVHEGHAAYLPAELEAPRHPGEAGEGFAGVLGVHPQLESRRHRGGGVAGVVETGHGQLEDAEALAGGDELETEVVAPRLDARDLYLRLPRRSRRSPPRPAPATPPPGRRRTRSPCRARPRKTPKASFSSAKDP